VFPAKRDSYDDRLSTFCIKEKYFLFINPITKSYGKTHWIPTIAQEKRRHLPVQYRAAGFFSKKFASKQIFQQGGRKRSKASEAMTRIVTQERQDKNKLYSLHEPRVCCIAKGNQP
jgi:hypothetical protein